MYFRTFLRDVCLLSVPWALLALAYWNVWWLILPMVTIAVLRRALSARAICAISAVALFVTPLIGIFHLYLAALYFEVFAAPRSSMPELAASSVTSPENWDECAVEYINAEYLEDLADLGIAGRFHSGVEVWGFASDDPNWPLIH